MEKGETTAAGDLIGVTIKFNGRSIPVFLSSDSTVRNLKSLLQPLTNVLPRGQKLIFKGRILDDEATLRSSKVPNGAKIMLMASQGLHQGVGPIGKEAPTSLRRMEMNNENRDMKKKREFTVEKSKFERWKATGVIALSGCNLRAIPDQVWSFGSSARVLDLSHNSLQDVPVSVGSLCSVQKLLLTANKITDGSISWEGLTSLKSLTVLSLSQNLLMSLPSALGAFTCLKQLYIENNELSYLPTEIGNLTQLEVLKANNNRLSTISTTIGECTSLVEIDISSNLLVELPESFGNLQNLKALDVSNNGLKSLPTALFKKCIQLSTLVLHSTEITLNSLRQFEGWEDFDERRRSKHQKQLDFRAGGSAEFDEGADKRF